MIAYENPLLVCKTSDLESRGDAHTIHPAGIWNISFWLNIVRKLQDIKIYQYKKHWTSVQKCNYYMEILASIFNDM